MIDQISEQSGEPGAHETGRDPWDDAAHVSPEDHAAAFGTASYDPHAHALSDHGAADYGQSDHGQADHGRLALGEDERLPWLDSADDVDHAPRDSGRFVGFIAIGSIALAALIGGIYWVSHSQTPSAQADGSLIEASKAPYKVEPSNPGGKTFQGTGDASYKVSEGQKPDGSKPDASKPDGSVGAAAACANGTEAKGAEAKAADNAPAAPKSAGAKPATATPAAANGAQGGVGVQIGAFSSHAAAEAAWGKLSAQYSALSGHSHRIVEGKADIGTVFRLQALAGDAGGARALCETLQGAGLHCQVKP